MDQPSLWPKASMNNSLVKRGKEVAMSRAPEYPGKEGSQKGHLVRAIAAVVGSGVLIVSLNTVAAADRGPQKPNDGRVPIALEARGSEMGGGPSLKERDVLLVTKTPTIDNDDSPDTVEKEHPDNHGRYVSAIARTAVPGPDHGRIVSEVARSKTHTPGDDDASKTPTPNVTPTGTGTVIAITTSTAMATTTSTATATPSATSTPMGSVTATSTNTATATATPAPDLDGTVTATATSTTDTDGTATPTASSTPDGGEGTMSDRSRGNGNGLALGLRNAGASVARWLAALLGLD